MTHQQVTELASLGMALGSSFICGFSEKAFNITDFNKSYEHLPGLEYNPDYMLYLDPTVPIEFYDFTCQTQLGINRQTLVYRLHKEEGFDKFLDCPDLFNYASPAEQRAYEDFRLNNIQLGYLWNKQIIESKIRDNLFMYDVYDPILDSHMYYTEVRPEGKVVTIIDQMIF